MVSGRAPQRKVAGSQDRGRCQEAGCAALLASAILIADQSFDNVRYFHIFPVVVLSGLAHCGGERGDLHAGQAAITNGQPYSGHPSVGYLQIGATGLCTATLVGKKTVLTAAHCIKAGEAHLFHLEGATYPAATATPHPAWNPDPQSLANDIAVIRLASEPPVTPSIIARQAVTVGLKITLIGFGVTADNLQDALVKRMATNSVKDLTSTRFSIAGTGGGIGNTCLGDSGGPAFASLGAREVQVGVTSAGLTPCGVLAWDTRVDAYLSWLTTESGGDLYDGTVADTEKPSVAITAPAAGGTVSPSVTVVVSATDNVGVATVECAVDGKPAGSMSAPPYEFALTLVEGMRTIRALARDKAGNQGEAQITVNVTTTPTPTPGAFGSTCVDNSSCQSTLCGLDTSSQRRFCTTFCDPAQPSPCPSGAACLSASATQNVCGPPPTTQNGLTGNSLVGTCAFGGAGCGLETLAPLLLLVLLRRRRQALAGT
jgi:hypothetical protein